MRDPESIAATLAFVALTAGLFWAWPPLGLIVPGGIVFGCLAWRRMQK